MDAETQHTEPDDTPNVEENDETWIALSDPDMSMLELHSVTEALKSPRLSQGPLVERFESEFADYLGRTYAVAVTSGTIGAVLALKAMGIGPGDEVIASPYSWHQIAHAIVHVGATPVLVDMNYWSGCIEPAKVAEKITPKTKAVIAGNINGHPADWTKLREIADAHGIKLIEDSTEAIGSRYLGKLVGSFGDVAIFDFSQPSALVCGEGGMVVTSDPHLATELRYLRNRALEDRFSISVGARVPLQGAMSDLAASLGLAQIERLDEILARRKRVEAYYLESFQTFEGIKPPYLAPDIDEVHWFLYVVHLGKRFERAARDQIIEDMETEKVETVAYCPRPMHLQYHYGQLGYHKTQFPLVERIADRAVALPFHGHLTDDTVEFIVATMKDSSINIGAGAAIYL